MAQVSDLRRKMRFHAKREDFIDLIHVYSTMAEELKTASISHFNDPARL